MCSAYSIPCIDQSRQKETPFPTLNIIFSWVSKSLLFLFLLCVFFQFQKASLLIHCRRILWKLICDCDYAVSVCAILTDYHLLGGILLSSGPPALIWFFLECKCHAAKSSPVVRSAYRPKPHASGMFILIVIWIKIHDSSANMWCVILWIFFVHFLFLNKLRCVGVNLKNYV